MTKHSSNNGQLTLINIHAVKAERAEELIEILSLAPQETRVIWPQIIMLPKKS